MSKIVSVKFIRSNTLSEDILKANDILLNSMVEINVQNSIPKINLVKIKTVSGRIRDMIKEDGLLNKK